MTHWFRCAALVAALALSIPAFGQTDTSRWMGELVDQYGAGPSPMDQSLAEFIFPGSHDAGTYRMRLAPACDNCRGGLRAITEVPGLELLVRYLAGPWSQAQGESIYGQLHSGSRVFDLRFFEVTPGDVVVAENFQDLVEAVVPDIDQYLDTTLMQVGDFHIHHTFAGPSSDEIWADINAYLAEPNHDNEVIILNLSQMRAATSNMNAASLRNFMREMFNAIGPQYFVPYGAPFAGMTLRDIQESVSKPQQQIIVVLDSSVQPAWQIGTDEDIDNLLWPKVQSAYAGTSPEVIGTPGGYPIADDWDTEGKLLSWMERIADQRTNNLAMWRSDYQLGPDETRFFVAPPLLPRAQIPVPGMIMRGLICNWNDIGPDPINLVATLVRETTGVDAPQELLDVIAQVNDGFGGIATEILVEEALDELFGICSAINDDWDRFRSLEEVAAYTNPKVLSALVALPRDDVNIVMADYFPPQFAIEAKRLNQGAVRVKVTITDVRERECHDCFPLTAIRLSDPDYFPEMALYPKDQNGVRVTDSWPNYTGEATDGNPGHESNWGGPWLETSGTHLRPNWTLYRGLAPDTPTYDLVIRLWDQDNALCPTGWPVVLCGSDDVSRISGFATDITANPSLPAWVGTFPVTERGFTQTRGGPFTECSPEDWVNLECSIELDSSVITYNISSCQWAALPGGSVANQDSCYPLPFGQPPVAVIDMDPSNVFSAEGGRIDVWGSNSFDADYPAVEGQLQSFEWDCDYTGLDSCVSRTDANDLWPASDPKCDAASPEFDEDYELASFIPGRACRGMRVYEQVNTQIPAIPQTFPSRMTFQTIDGPREGLQVALRVTDLSGEQSNIAVSSPISVANVHPFWSGFELTQVPGTYVIEATAFFYDYAEDDRFFDCELASGGVTKQGEVELLGAAMHPVTPQLITTYACRASFRGAPGTVDVSGQRLSDKDFGDYPGVPPTETIVLAAVADADNDGWGDIEDNCPAVANASQADTDSDGIGDVCDQLSNLVDGTPGSLRDVIAQSPAGNIITFDPSASGGVIALTAGELPINAPITIDASALPDGITIDAGGASRAMSVNSFGAPVTLRNVTIRDGSAVDGGCIYKAGTSLLLLERSTMTGCQASGVGGAVHTAQGDVTIADSTISGNQAATHAGIYGAFGTNILRSTVVQNTTTTESNGAGIGSPNLRIRSSIIAMNGYSGGGSFGSDVDASGSVVVEGTSFIGANDTMATEFPADGVLVGTFASPLDPELLPLGGYGGQTHTMPPRSVRSPVVDAATIGADVDPDQRGTARPGGALNDLGAVERLGSDPSDIDGDTVLDGSDNCPTISNVSQADDPCRPLTSLADDGSADTLRDIIARASNGHIITFDPSVSGGTLLLAGVALQVDKEITIDALNLPNGLTISGDDVSGIFEVQASGNLSLEGLTIIDGDSTFSCIDNDGAVTIERTTIDGCTGVLGGAVHNRAGRVLSLINSTLVNNESATNGGAVYNLGTATINHSTIIGNTADPAGVGYRGGGIYSIGALNLENSIVAGNSIDAGTAGDVFGAGVTALGANLIGSNSGVEAVFPAGPLVGTALTPLDPGLYPYGNYGGPTPTMKPLATSPAIDSALVTGNSPALDQRGVARPQGAGNDLGATERQASDIDIDTDNDGIPDVIDPDDDNDGVLDADDDYPLGRFDDATPGYWAFQFIEALARAGITGGCGGTNYCPNDTVTRAQMAVFLERGIRGSNYIPPAALGTVFGDVGAGDFAAAWIEQLFADGITGGCGGGNYCPNDSVTRAQMAVFLLRAKYGSGYAPPAGTGVFADVSLSNFAIDWIEQLAVEGITSGCGGGNYCPDDPVTRAQMAVFLVRTFGL